MQATLPVLMLRQSRVVAALVLREMRSRFGRHQLGYLWTIIRPLILLSILVFIFRKAGRPAPFGNSMPLFFATGVLPFYLFSRTMRNMATAIDKNEALFEYPWVTPVDALLARGILEVVTYTSVTIIGISGIIVFFDTPLPDRVHVLAVALAGLGLLGFGMGCINAVVGSILPAWRAAIGLMQRGLIFFSAVMHPTEGLPLYIRDILAWNPIVHGIELFRSGYYMGYRCSILDVGYLFTFGLMLCLIGLAAERTVRLRAA